MAVHSRLRVAMGIVLTVAVAVAAATPASAAEIDDLRAEVTAAREAADQATARYMETVNRLEGLEVEIAAIEREIVGHRERIADLRASARARAVLAYTQRGVELAALQVDRPLERARREKLLAQANARDHAVIARLGVATETLAARERELRGLRAEARDARDRLAVEQAELDRRLQSAKQALAAFEERIRREEAARQERERARLAAQRSSSARDYSNAYVATGLVCPIRGPVSFIDSWGFPRQTTGWHQGVDLMSPRGPANVAVVAGEAQMRSGSTSGLGVWLYGDDGNLYYYFHLDAFEGGARRVQQGEVVGYTGNTGDASGGATHTHFEIHPGGGPAVNPYPTVVQIC
jgi:murein DD-endopeptidase MepM/ murein hydrolase activator NlpD